MNKPMSFSNDLVVIKVLLTVLFLCSRTETVIAQTNQIDLNALTVETQRTLPDADRITLVWWVPEEFWQVTLAQEPTVTKTQVDAFVNTLSPYTLLVVVDGKIGAGAKVTYKSEETIRNTIKLIDNQGTIYLPLSKEKVDASIKSLLSIMKPVLSNTMGQMGENMNFIIFSSKSQTGQKIVDPRREGSFSISLGENKFVWRLPLGALLPAKVCPVDGERLNGAWKFCPWHGEKLISKPTK